ncbi:hypothetical protein A1OE_53 [Candidatus Endolissoclinum faulkneri L2]|uniref:Uncharacterized protein n=1 Tax=Candidatus Endolissoclinum faulkneri L2 TaxID=1193729 RepID=K7YLA2_9PROT|nr:hypothetical protein A1OE_53 [Candidatus Endolissoclinum faulkneri L2]
MFDNQFKEDVNLHNFSNIYLQSYKLFVNVFGILNLYNEISCELYALM